MSNCAGPGLLAGIVCIDLFGIDEETACRRLREMIEGAIAGRQKPKVAPNFPGSEQSGRQPPFPGLQSRTSQQTSAGKEEEATVTDISTFRLRSDVTADPDLWDFCGELGRTKPVTPQGDGLHERRLPGAAPRVPFPAASRYGRGGC